MSQPNCAVVLRAAGVGVVLDLSAGRLPAIVHWGADLGELTAADVAALTLAAEPPLGSQLPDEPMRLALLPEHWTGWLGRPGLSGSRQGRDWSPKFTTSVVLVDGAEVTEPVRFAWAGTVAVEAVDEVAGLGLGLTSNCCPAGCCAAGPR